MRKRRVHGFTMIEIVVVLAVAALLMSIAVPAFLSSSNAGKLRAHSRKLSNDLKRAQSIALSRTGENCPTGSNIKTTGIRVVSNNRTYEMFGLCNDASQTRVVYKVHTFPDGYNMHFKSPAVGKEMRFKRNGTVIPGPFSVFKIKDDSGTINAVSVSLTGSTKITTEQDTI